MKPLLTIAIPTYNRSKILNESLGVLLPQICIYGDNLELVISDNASNDNTQEVISKYKNKFKEIKFVVYLQEVNTGFFGNFKKCRELSSGKYFWLLSDNERLHSNIFQHILDFIKINAETGVFYLNNVSNRHRPSSFPKCENSSLENLIDSKEFYKLTLISSVIFLNFKAYDNEVYKDYPENIFLGFFYLINALRYNPSVKKITGCIYSTSPATVNCNVFEAWTIELLPVLDYMVNTKLITITQKLNIIQGYLPILKRQLDIYKRTGMLGGKKHGNLYDIKNLLDNHFISIDYYSKRIAPIFSKRLFRLKVEYFASKVAKKVARSIKMNKLSTHY